MAYARSAQYNHLVSWNIKGEGHAQERKKTVSTYLGALKPSANILFLQEVQWAPVNLRNHLSTLGDHYELSHYSQEYKNCYNCVIFDKRKFEALPANELETPLNNCFKQLDKWREWEKRGFRTSQERQMKNRMCLVVLNDRNESCKFITASLHNLNEKCSMQMAELFLQLLALLGETTGYPVVLAGDFNANIHKSSEVTRLGFTVPEYKPTVHRLDHKSPIDVTIDFFLYRPGKSCSVVLHDVKAEVAISDVMDNKGNIDDKKMDALHRVSNHDPLRATLQLSSTAATQRQATTKPLAAVRPSSSASKVVVKSIAKVSPPTASKTTVSAARVKQEPKPTASKTTVGHVKQEPQTFPKSRPVSTTVARIPSKSSSACQTVIKASSSKTTVHSRSRRKV